MSNADLTTIKPVILSGGSGTRLWPLSRQLYPKQLLPLVTDKTMLQDTITRLHDSTSVSDSVIVVCNESHRFMVAEQLLEVNVESDAILLEPMGRNTAPALTLAAITNTRQGNDDILLVLPADHVISNIAAFHQTLEEAKDLSLQGYLVTFGIVPTRAETGYGYIKSGKAIENSIASEIGQFVEKPDSDTAQQYLDSGDYLWNSGMFMMKSSIWLDQIKKFQPDIYTTCEQAYEKGAADFDFYRLDTESFENCPSDSIDYAVMEKMVENADEAVHTAVLPLDAGWSDVGAWDELWKIGNKDQHGNVVHGDVVSHNSSDSIIYSQERLVAALGLENIVVVETADAILVADKNKVQDVKHLVEWIKDNQRQEHLNHRCVYRPWGCYDSVDMGDRYQVKRITVNPGAKLSLQMHHHRAEHWIVVKGTATVTRGDETFLVSENESTYIPVGTKHRLENPGAIPLEMIEVQSGGYLGEDDIVRYDDQYGRESKS